MYVLIAVKTISVWERNALFLKKRKKLLTPTLRHSLCCEYNRFGGEGTAEFVTEAIRIYCGK